MPYQPPQPTVTHGQTTRIELNFLLKNKFIEKDNIKGFSLTWTCGNSIQAISNHKDGECYLNLIYSVIDRFTKEKTSYSYKIDLVGVPSNLGKGEVLYFVCPSTGRRCRILYMAHGAKRFYSRYHYEKLGLRIYYQCQTASKQWYANTRYWTIKRDLEKREQSQRRQDTYNGVGTREAVFRLRKRLELNELDRQRSLAFIAQSNAMIEAMKKKQKIDWSLFDKNR